MLTRDFPVEQSKQLSLTFIDTNIIAAYLRGESPSLEEYVHLTHFMLLVQFNLMQKLLFQEMTMY
jgi:hypothetical protein